MASGFFAVLDDIAYLMDDVVTMGKLATKKTAGILGDDLSVNAEKATGFVSSRELPVLWKITKGSFLNKLIILPIAFLLSYFFSLGIKIVLVLGGVYLAYEGMHKIVHFIAHKRKSKKQHAEVLEVEITDTEKEKIKSAITTDFILSVEIIIIALGTVLEESLAVQIMVVSFVSLLATVGVYGIVALIVRMDDAGLSLVRKSKGKGFLFVLGNALIQLLPWVIKVLAVVGTFALLLVAGGIFSHNIHFFHDLLPTWPAMLKELLLGIVVGIIAVILLTLITKILPKKKAKI